MTQPHAFSGHTFHYELLQYIENSFNALKKVFTSLQSTDERVAGLYLMYAMFFKQPVKDFGRYRFTVDEWSTVKTLWSEIEHGDEFMQARLILWYLWISNAFRFVECDLDIETIQSRSDFALKMFSFRKIKSKVRTDIAEMGNESSGLLKAIDLLQMGYNEMKEHLAATIDECSGLATSDMTKDFNQHMDHIIENFDDKVAHRPKKRQGAAAKRTESDGSQSDSESNTSGHDNQKNDDAESDSNSEDIGNRRGRLKRKALNMPTKPLRFIESKSPVAEKQARRIPPGHAKEISSAGSPTRLQKIKRKIEIDDKSGNVFIFNVPSRSVRSKRMSCAKKQLQENEYVHFG